MLEPGTCARLARVAIIVAPLIAVSGCRDSSETEQVADDAGPVTVTLSDAPPLAALSFADRTPSDVRPSGCADMAADATSAAFFGAHGFVRAAEGTPGACEAAVAVGYALIQNKRPVIDAEAGEVRVVVEADLTCPGTGGKEDTFRVRVDETEAFGQEAGRRDAGWRVPMRSALRRGAERAAQVLHGQTRVRHATDAAITRALGGEAGHTGVLAEAASEAGERGLADAKDALVRLTAHDSDLVAIRAGAALGLLRAQGDEVVRALARMTRGPNEDKHLAAIHALGDIGGAAAVRYLRSVADSHPSAGMRRLARDAAERAAAGRAEVQE